MIVTSIHDWLAEQEHRKNHAIFLLEWLAIFTLAWLFWTCVLFELHVSASSITTAAAISTIYASAFVYIRLYKESACKKCNSPLLFNREEIGRRYVHNEEQCVEIEHGGVEWMEHYIDIYSRLYRVRSHQVPLPQMSHGLGKNRTISRLGLSTGSNDRFEEMS